jgi:hypothetical protein
MTLLVDKYLTVTEARFDVDTGIDLLNGTYVDISVSGSIWAGVWFTGTNGPEGWAGHVAGSDYPLPGVAPFSLLGKTAQDGYFMIGGGLRRTYYNATVPNEGTRLYLRINDNIPNNGNGQFLAHVSLWKGLPAG